MPLMSGGNLYPNSGFDDIYQDFGSPALGTAAMAHAAVTLATGATTVVTTAFTQPTTSRNATVTGNQATAVGNVVISGTDYDDGAITETIIAAGAATVVGNYAFKTITSVTFPQRGAAGDTLSIGYGAKLGLCQRLSKGLDTVLRAFLGGTKQTVDTWTTAANASTLALNTLTIASALNGTKVECYFIEQ